MLSLIYPEKRHISEADVIAWARDRRVTVAMNGEMAEWPRSTNFDADRGETVITITVKDPTLAEAIDELSDQGVATFAQDEIDIDAILHEPCGRCGSPECFGGCETEPSC